VQFLSQDLIEGMAREPDKAKMNFMAGDTNDTVFFNP